MLAVSLGAGALALPLLADTAPPHGYVEPCTLSFVADGTMECEECSPTQSHPDFCKERFGGLGYEKKCRTAAHSAPSEVWCISNQRKEELRRLQQEAAHGQQAARTPYVPILAAASATAVLGLVLFLKRRRSAAK